jgi:hypothetical protein
MEVLMVTNAATRFHKQAYFRRPDCETRLVRAEFVDDSLAFPDHENLDSLPKSSGTIEPSIP